MPNLPTDPDVDPPSPSTNIATPSTSRSYRPNRPSQRPPPTTNEGHNMRDDHGTDEVIGGHTDVTQAEEDEHDMSTTRPPVRRNRSRRVPLGPLSPEDKERRAIVRKIGACDKCRKQKCKVRLLCSTQIFHIDMASAIIHGTGTFKSDQKGSETEEIKNVRHRRILLQKLSANCAPRHADSESSQPICHLTYMDESCQEPFTRN
jgi:hypothetical protein